MSFAHVFNHASWKYGEELIREKLWSGDFYTKSTSNLVFIKGLDAYIRHSIQEY